jgi:hypothetical protein
MKQRSTIETMQRLASQMDGLALASRGMRAIRPAKKIVTMPKKVRNVTIDTNDECLYPEYETETEKADCEAEIDYIGSFENSPVEEEIEEAEEIELEVVSIESEEVKQIMEQPIDAIEAEQKTVTKKDGTTTSGYGSETSGDTTDQQLLKQQQMQKEKEQSMTGDDHCVRCHKTFDAKSASSAEMRCVLPHPTKNVVPIRRDDFGTDFVCLCCRTEFRLPKMAFYEAGVNSMLTGHCFVGQHTLDKCEIDYQQGGGAALSCEENGCIEYFV